MTWQGTAVNRMDVLTWQVNPTRFAEAGRRRSVACLRRIGARGQSRRRRVRACRTSVLLRIYTSGFFWLSYTRWYIQKHVLRTLIFEFGLNTLFFKNQTLIPIVGYFQNSNTHKFTWFGNLSTPRSYWFILINLTNNTNNKTRRRRKFFSTQLNSP